MAIYDAFISYSHAKDKPIAAALQAAIQKLGKPWYRRRALRAFRDDTSLSATPHLWPTIEQALGQSRFFLLLTSPEAAASKWVNKEASYWIEHNSVDTLLIGLTDGELVWNEVTRDFIALDDQGIPLPPILAKRFLSEPKWVDLRSYRASTSKRDHKFTELAADFAAAIRGIPKEDLLSQEVLQQRRALRSAWSAVVLLLFFIATAYQEKQEVVKERNLANATLADVTKIASESLDRLGDAQVAQGKLADALVSYRASLTIREGQAQSDPGNAGWQRDLSVSCNKIGDVQAARGDLAGALKSYDDGLAIRERLAQSDPGNAGWQRDLAMSYGKLAGAYRQSNDPDKALAALRQGQAVMNKLTMRSPDNAGWKRDLAWFNDQIAALTK